MDLICLVPYITPKPLESSCVCRNSFSNGILLTESVMDINLWSFGEWGASFSHFVTIKGNFYYIVLIIYDILRLTAVSHFCLYLNAEPQSMEKGPK